MKLMIIFTLCILIDIHSSAYKNIFSGSTDLEDNDVPEKIEQDVPEYARNPP